MYLPITNQERLPNHDLSEGDSNQSFFRRQWDSDQINAATRHWLAGDEQYFLRQTLSTPCLNVLESCQGSTLTNIQGRDYLDFHAKNVHQVGFGNPAVIAEPIRSTTVNPPPAGYWKEIRLACDRHGALLIFDETAIGLGKTGRMFAAGIEFQCLTCQFPDPDPALDRAAFRTGSGH